MRENPNRPFPLAEDRGRLDKVRAELAARGIEACLTSAPENIYYSTGFTSVYDILTALDVAMSGHHRPAAALARVV